MAVFFSLSLVAATVSATDRADEYLPFTRLTDNYEINNRKQNYDEFKFPTSISNRVRVEGDKIVIEYGYQSSGVNSSKASILQFQRHFDGLVSNAGGEIAYSGQTNEHKFAVTFKFPKNGKVVWGLASTANINEVYRYSLLFVETNEIWGVATPTSTTAPKLDPIPEPAIITAAVAVSPATELDVPWSGGEWKAVNRGGCDVPDVRRSKSAVPDDEYCDAKMNGKVVICIADEGGCFYKNVTPQQCNEGLLQGRMYVCVGK